MDYSASVIMAAAATVTAVVWIIFFLSGNKKYTEIMNTSALKKYRMHCIFFIGFEIMGALKINIRGERYALKRSRIAAVYGLKYTEYHTYVLTGAQLTYAATLLPFVLMISAASGKVEAAVIGATASVLLSVYPDYEIRRRANEKNEILLCELPSMLSRLTLLINAGMVLRDAWSKIASSSDSVLCREMLMTSREISNGVSEAEAFNAFAERCCLKEVSKLTSLLNQNIQKGNSELVKSLKIISGEQWEEKKNSVTRKSDAIDQKLLFPMLLIFLAIIIMIIVPVFVNMI